MICATRLLPGYDALLLGAAVLLWGWLASIAIFVVPASLLRHFKVAPFSRLLAIGLSLAGYVVWFSI